MRFKSWALAAPLLATLSGNALVARAQETLAGVGAASAAGATLGATGAANLRGRGGAPTGAPNGAPTGDDMDGQGNPNFPGSGSTTTTTTTTTTRVSTPFAGRPGSGSGILGQLLAPPQRPTFTPTRVRRSAKAQAAYSRRVGRLSPTARKKLVLNKYRIAPRGYLASYLPADRYKFAKAWKYVSTETDVFYYRPQDMARRGFNANRVIGFRTWQDAMLAGYRPDPVSKPEPGNQLAFLASLTRDDALTQYVEYVYAGQVSPASVTNTTNYVRRVKSLIDRNPTARKYQRDTVNSILMASLTGDASLIPRQLGYVPPVATAPEAGSGMQGDRGGIMGGDRGGDRGSSSGSSGAGGAVMGKGR